MELEDLGPEVRNEIKYRILTVKYTRDDPVLQAYMIKHLLEAYKKHKLEVPPTIIKYIKAETRIMQQHLKEEIEKKKKQMEKRPSKKQ